MSRVTGLEIVVICLGSVGLVSISYSMARRGTWSRHRLCLEFFIVRTGGRVWRWGGELNDGFWAYWVEIRVAFLVLLSQGRLPSVQPERSQKFRGE